jgi:hypothetical protein
MTANLQDPLLILLSALVILGGFYLYWLLRARDWLLSDFTQEREVAK